MKFQAQILAKKIVCIRKPLFFEQNEDTFPHVHLTVESIPYAFENGPENSRVT